MPKGKKKTRSGKEQVAPLYSQELGLQGVKRHREEAARPIASLKLTREERERRKDRMVRRLCLSMNSVETLMSQYALAFTGAIRGGTHDSNPKYLPNSDPSHRPLAAARKESSCAETEASKGINLKPFVGTNTSLEKPYLRLTTYPKAAAVRPLHILYKSLQHIQRRYTHDEDFEYANEQLKSVRQDLTVQGIRNDRLVLDVYETHARILLEHGDLAEFNQCQTVIQSLVDGSSSQATVDEGDNDEGGGIALVFSDDNHSTRLLLAQSPVSTDEFRGYGLLYALVRNDRIQLHKELRRTTTTIVDGVVGQSSTKKQDFSSTTTAHALAVIRSVVHHEYATFFRHYDAAPHMSAYLMDFLVKRVRDDAYRRIIAAYRPTVSVEQVQKWLHLDDVEETLQYLKHAGAVFVVTANLPDYWVDCKKSMATDSRY